MQEGKTNRSKENSLKWWRDANLFQCIFFLNKDKYI